MAVIINEFEIVVEPSKQEETDLSNTQPSSPSTARLSPRDMQMLLSYQLQRNLRVAAH